MVGRRRVWFEAGIWPCDQTGNVGRRAVRDVGRWTTFHVGSCESSVLTTGRRLDVPPSVRGPRVSGVRRLWPSGRPLLKRGSLLCLRLPGSAGGVAASGSRDFWNGLEPARGPGLGSSAAPSRCDSAGALPCGLAAAARSAPARRRRGQGRRPHAGRRGGLRPRLGQLGACPSVPLETFRPDACADEADPRDPSSGCEALSVGVAPRLESCPLLLSFLRKITVLNRASGFILQEVTSQRFPFLRGVHSALTGHDAGPRSTDDTADPCSSTPSHARAGVEGGSGHPHRPARPPSPHLQVSRTLSRDQEEKGPKREGPRSAASRHL